jgi:hypothetical protein
MLGSTPGPSGNAWLYQLHFQVASQLRIIGQLCESNSIITETRLQKD